MLETKWKLLQEQTTARSNTDVMFEAYIANLRKQLDNLGHEKLKLESDLHQMTDLVEDYKIKWVQSDRDGDAFSCVTTPPLLYPAGKHMGSQMQIFAEAYRYNIHFRDTIPFKATLMHCNLMDETHSLWSYHKIS